MGKKEELSQQFIAIDQSRQKEHTKKFKKLKKKDLDESFKPNNPGVVYLGHIPHGFFEPQIKAYLSQFGDITKLRLSRSKKTGNSKGYAYVEFKYKEVAETVAETMNNYLMFDKLLKCEVVPYDKLHPATFKGANQPFKKPFHRSTAVKRLNKTKTEKAKHCGLKKVEAKNSKLLKRLQELGIEYNLKKIRVDDLESKNIIVPKKEKTADTSVLNETPSSGENSGFFVIDEDDEEVTFKIPPESASKVRYMSRINTKNPENSSKIPIDLNSK